MSDDDTLDALDALRRVDPLAGDGEEPPAKGSTRYRAILERAMDTDGIDDATPTTTAPAPTPPGRADRPSLPADDDAPALRPADRDRTATRGRRRRIVTLSAAAVALAVAGVATVLRADNGVTPAVAITSAAETTAGVTSLRGTLTSSDPAAEHATAFEVAGDDMRMESLATYADGHVEGNTMVVIDDQSTQVALDGSVEYGTIERPSPFGASSAAVVTAAVDHGRAVDLGTEEVRGIEATHYRIEPDDAVQQSLSGLAPNILAWFGLEQVDAVTAIDIWVADDLIRRIQVVAVHPAERTNVPGEYTTTIEFYDFNAAIEIEPLVVDPSAPVVGDE